MLKLHFSTRNGFVKTDDSKLIHAIYTSLCLILFISVMVAPFSLWAYVNSSPAYALSESPSKVNPEFPTINALGNVNFYRPVSEGQLLEFTVSASDPDGDPLTFSASNLPDGASFDAETHTFSWTPRYDQAGVYVVRFEVSDGELNDFEDVTITVIQLYEDWDVNGDETANILDMILVGQHWGETGLTGWIQEDANEDGTISVLDMIVIGQNWTG